MADEIRETPKTPTVPRSGSQSETDPRAGSGRAGGGGTPVGSSERMKDTAEGQHIPAKTPDGKPYGSDWDPDSHEKGTARTGDPGNEV